jgi:hypothetical protein
MHFSDTKTTAVIALVQKCVGDGRSFHNYREVTAAILHLQALREEKCINSFPYVYVSKKCKRHKEKQKRLDTIIADGVDTLGLCTKCVPDVDNTLKMMKSYIDGIGAYESMERLGITTEDSGIPFHVF